MTEISVLFVCMGNICRSPTGQGVFERLLADRGLSTRIEADSAGTHAYHVGEPPDRRAAIAAARRGIDLSRYRARRIAREDFVRFDYVLAMDSGNLEDLIAICPEEYGHKLFRLLDFAPEMIEQDVPDPYYGGAQGFEHVLDLVEAGVEGLLEDIRRRL